MPSEIIVSVGSDMTNHGKFYWDIKKASTRDVIEVRKGFSSLEEAKTNLKESHPELLNEVVIENLAIES